MDDVRTTFDARRRGLATIEAAIVLPLLLLMTLGLIEYGWMFMKAQQVTNAARQGARVAARADATTVEVQQAVLDAMTMANLELSGYSLTINPVDPATPEPGQLIAVTVSVNYPDIELGMPLIPTPAALDETVTMAKEGP
jgi:Flp pilus assembly protein TadG